MADLKERALAKWQAYSQKEKKIIIIFSAGIIAILFYFYYWQPLLEQNQLLRRQNINRRQELQWLQTSVGSLGDRLSSGNSAHKSIPMVKQISLLQQKMKAANFNPNNTQLKQTNKNTIEINFQKINFDQLLTLLHDVQTTLGLNISNLSVAAIDQSLGLVTGKVQLSTQALR